MNINWIKPQSALKAAGAVKSKTSLSQRFFLLVFGVLCCILIIEIGLRLGGLAFSSLQQHRNYLSIKQKGAYRILCLGESTTARQYPPFLEEILNQRNIGIRFSVIDKGVVGTNTAYILDRLESNLETYHPDMVIAMMGNNDRKITYYKGIPEADSGIFQHCRTYRFMRLIYMHIVSKLRGRDIYGLNMVSPQTRTRPEEVDTIAEEDFSPSQESLKIDIARDSRGDQNNIKLGRYYQQEGKFPEAEASFRKAIELNPKNDIAYVELGRSCLSQGKFAAAEASFKKALEINPKNAMSYVELGRSCLSQGKFAAAEASFKKAIELNPKNDMAYIELGWFYRDQSNLANAEASFKKAIELKPKNTIAYVELGRFYRGQGKPSEAEALFKKAIECNPKDALSYVALGWFYRGQGKPSEAEASFKKAIELNPKSVLAYVELGRFYRDQGKPSEAEALFKKAIELNPKNTIAYAELGRSYLSQGKPSDAEALFKKAIELNPKNTIAYGALKAIYIEMGNSELASEYDRRAKELGLNYYPPMTISNYHKLKAALDKRGIRLVCAQYPMRSIEPLKSIFQDNTEGIIFVDNEGIFKDAIKQGGYNDYFRDMFGGDFGHCTNKGNRLLAENIANVILKEAFGK
jgi:tetratricopeptide (TPR) repeat protein